MSSTVPMQITGCRCLRCQYIWIPRTTRARPYRCPSCKSPRWYQAYKYKTYAGKPHRNLGVRRGER